jgi:uncharacterized protein YbaA (DUF1428 family)
LAHRSDPSNVGGTVTCSNRGEQHLNRLSEKPSVKVMSDPRLSGMDPKSMPFDCKRMVYGGFKELVAS